MSQKVKIIGVKHSGSPVFLGMDKSNNPICTCNSDRIMEWLCNGWRFRFNQHRSYRTVRKPFIDEKTQDRVWLDVPLGGYELSKPLTDKEARDQFSWLSALPAMVISSTLRVENTDWFASLKRIKSTKSGKTPGFKSRHRNPQQFLCWFNGGQNALFQKTGKRTGMVTIKGQNKAKDSKPGSVGLRWKIQIRVRISQEIRTYTSVNVNWSARTLVFTNPPAPLSKEFNGKAIGVDRGVAHTLATSDGQFFDIPRESQENQEKYLKLQRRLARQDRTNEARGGKSEKFKSKRRAKTLREMQRIRSHESNRAQDWIHKTSRELVEKYDLLVLEELKTKNMTKRARNKNVRAKSGLNRAILSSRWSMFARTLQYKAELVDTQISYVNPAYTSQMCSECKNVASENRESQAVFRCVSCGHSENADINAAKNILAKITGQDDDLERGVDVRPLESSESVGNDVEALTPAL